MLPLAGGQPFPFAATPDEDRNAKMSPDGRYVAYTFVQGGKSDVFVQPYPATGAKWQISRDGGQYDRLWKDADGRTLFYVSADKRFMAVDVSSREAAFASGQPRIAGHTHRGSRPHQSRQSLCRDSRRVAVHREHSRRHPVVPITVVPDRQALLEK